MTPEKLHLKPKHTSVAIEPILGLRRHGGSNEHC